MSPTSRQESRAPSQVPGHKSVGSSEEPDEGSYKSEHDENLIQLPSGLVYSLEELDEETRDHISTVSDSSPPLVLNGCLARDQYVTFLVSEAVEYTIRAGAPGSEWSVPICNCEEGLPSHKTPCYHILWLFDQVSEQVLDDHGHVLKMNEKGYAEELSNPYNFIDEFHLDILADSLHTRTLGPGSEDDPPNPRRVKEARELLATLNNIPVDDYRPDLFTNSEGDDHVIERDDLECTIFRMLLDNNEFFHYFLSEMQAEGLVGNIFTRLQQRADAVLAGLDAFLENPNQEVSSRPKNVEWCAQHLQLVVQQVRTAIQNTKSGLSPSERQAAARTLLHVLRMVVQRHEDVSSETAVEESGRNLYYNLIGKPDQGKVQDQDQDHDHSFVVKALNAIPPEDLSPFVGDLTEIIDQITALGAPASYREKLRGLLQRVRSSRTRTPSIASTSGSGFKRQAGSHDRQAKRMK
ncbi:hypothetical protein BX600DRAFT_507917 [Xylariales sp. PMI_506]|nr:hypothetical protein BX600DRAFT_507917 [Xylariales sp. PMI_506]